MLDDEISRGISSPSTGYQSQQKIARKIGLSWQIFHDKLRCWNRGRRWPRSGGEAGTFKNLVISSFYNRVKFQNKRPPEIPQGLLKKICLFIHSLKVFCSEMHQFEMLIFSSQYCFYLFLLDLKMTIPVKLMSLTWKSIFITLAVLQKFIIKPITFLSM